MPVSWNSPNLKQHDSTYKCLIWRLAWRNVIRLLDSTFPHISKCSRFEMWYREPNLPNFPELLMIKFTSIYISYKSFTNCLWTPFSNNSPKDQLLQHESRDSSENIYCRDTFDEVNDNIMRAVKLNFIEISVCGQCCMTNIFQFDDKNHNALPLRSKVSENWSF